MLGLTSFRVGKRGLMSSGIFWFQTRTADGYQWKISKRYNLNPCMMMSSNGDIFRVTGLLCAEFTGPRPVTRSFDIFLDFAWIYMYNGVCSCNRYLKFLFVILQQPPWNDVLRHLSWTKWQPLWQTTFSNAFSWNFFLQNSDSSPIHNKPALVEVMAWRRTGDKPSPEPITSVKTTFI